MTEEEKIFAGRLFDARTKELRDIKHKAHILCQKFNAMDEYDPARLPIVREFIGRIGEKYYFQGPIQFNYGSHTFIGENFFCNFNLTVMDDARIHIGNNVWIAANAVVLGGVTIGDGAVIGAGSVVTRDIPANHLAVGVPCRPLREITEADSKMHLL